MSPFSVSEAMVVEMLTAPNPKENGSLVSRVTTPRTRRPIAAPRVSAQTIVVISQRVRLAEANQR